MAASTKITLAEIVANIGNYRGIVDQLNANLSQQLGLVKDINDALTLQQAKEVAVKEAAGEYLDKLKLRMETEERLTEFWKEAVQLKQAQSELSAEAIEKLKEELATVNQIAEANEANKKEGKVSLLQYIQEKAQLDAKIVSLNEILDNNKLSLEDAKKQLLLVSRTTKMREVQAGIQERLTKHLGMSLRFQDSMIGKAVILSKEAGGFGKTMKGAWEALKDSMTFGNIGASLMAKVVESTIAVVKEVNSATTSFNKLTGAAGAYDDMILEVQYENRSWNVEAAKASEAMQSLYQSFTGFTTQSEAVKKQLTTTAAKMMGLGISADTSGKLVADLVQVLGVSVDDTEGLTKELAAAALAIGLVPSKMIEGFQAAMPKLAVYGDRAIKIYEDLAAATKTTGIETSRLLDMMSQFDTFDGAASAAGNLNSLLGGDYLNTMHLLNTSEEKRLEIVRQSLSLANKQFSALSKQEKQAIAAAIGISDMAEATRLFGMSMSEWEANKKLTDEASISNERWQEVVAKGVPLMEKFANVMRSFAVALVPILYVLNGVLDGILSLTNTKFFGWAMAGLGGIFSLVGALRLLKKGFQAAAAVKGVLTGLTAASAGAELLEAHARERNAFAATGETGALVGNTGAKITNTAANGGFAASLLTLGKAATVGAIGFLALGAAALMVGAGIYLAAIGMAQFVGAINNWQQIVGIIVFFVGLAAAVWALGAAGMVVGPGLFIVTTAVATMSLAISIAANRMSGMADSIGEMIRMLTKMPSDVEIVTRFSALTNSIESTSEVATKLTKSTAFEDLISSTSSLSQDSVKRVESLVQSAAQYSKVQADLKSPDQDSFLQSIKSVVELTANNAKEAVSSGSKEIVLVLNEREFARAVIDAFNGGKKQLSIAP